MADAPEIPEAKNPFDKRVAISIAILAMLLSFITNHGDDANTESLRLTTEAANQWAYYQAQSLKEHFSDQEIDILGTLSTNAVDPAKRDAVMALAKIEKANYEKKRTEATERAHTLEKEVRYQLAVNKRCDLAQLILQVAVIICSLGILSKSHWFWYKGLLLGAIGMVIGGSAWLVPAEVNGAEEVPASAPASIPATAPAGGKPLESSAATGSAPTP